MSSDAEKKARLAEALRANLRRRKARARAIDGQPPAEEQAPTPASTPEDQSPA